MADLILSDLTKPGTTPLNLVLDDFVIANRAESIEADVFWRFEDEPTAVPQLLGTVSAGKSLQVPLDLTHGRKIRLFAVSRTAGGNLSTQNVLEAVQTVFDPNGSTPGMGAPPTALTGSETSPGTASLSWTNNGGTGNNNIQRKRGASGTYEDVGSVSSSTDNFDDGPLITAGLYYYRIFNADVPGFSNEFVIYLTP